jgi:hypothetical protein
VTHAGRQLNRRPWDGALSPRRPINQPPATGKNSDRQPAEVVDVDHTVYIGATPDPSRPGEIDWFEGRPHGVSHLGTAR